MAYRYKAEILEQLRAHGIQPTPETKPELVHEFVNDLYRYELRRLRDRLLRREVQKAQSLRSRRGGQAPISCTRVEAVAVGGGR